TAEQIGHERPQGDLTENLVAGIRRPGAFLLPKVLWNELAPQALVLEVLLPQNFRPGGRKVPAHVWEIVTGAGEHKRNLAGAPQRLRRIKHPIAPGGWSVGRWQREGGAVDQGTAGETDLGKHLVAVAPNKGHGERIGRGYRNFRVPSTGQFL